MVFSLGNLLTLAIVFLVLIVYRQLDKNNRSLDKVKRYADKIKEQLDLFVDSKTQEVKNLAIELEVHQKTSKEVLKRIASEAEGFSSHAEEMEQLNQKISLYDKTLDRLNGLTATVEENLKRIQNESVFVDTVGKRIKETQASLLQLEKNIPGLTKEFSKLNQEQLKGLSSQVRKHTEDEVGALKGVLSKIQGEVRSLSEYTGKLEEDRETVQERLLAQMLSMESEALGRMENNKNNTLSAFSKELEGTRQVLDSRISGFQENLSELESQYRENMESLASEGRELSGEIFGNIRAIIEDRAAETEKRLRRLIDDTGEELSASRDDLYRSFEDARDNFNSWKSSLDEEMAESRARYAEEYKVFVRDLRSGMESFSAEWTGSMEERKKEAASFIDALSLRVDQFEKDSAEKLQGLEESLSQKEESFIRRLEESEADLEKRFSEERGSLDSRFIEFNDITNKTLAEIEQKIREFEGEVSYRFEAVDGIGTEIEELEKNLNISMEQAAKRLHDEYAAFEKTLSEERKRDSEKAASDAAAVREMMEALEKDLNELKSRAYENVSEKLKVFEDEFFSDLKDRGSAMDSHIAQWKAEVERRLDENREEQALSRDAMEKRYTDELKNRIGELQNRIYSQYDKFESQIAGYQERLQERMNLTSDALKGFEEELKREVKDIKEQSRLSFEKEFGEHSALITGQLKKHERELEANMKELGENLSVGQKELSALLEASRSDITIWQAQILQQFRQSENQVQETITEFKTDVLSTVDALKNSFETQKEDLILGTSEERDRLKNEIKQLGDSVVELESELRTRTEGALEAFSREWNEASLEFQKRAKDLSSEADQRIRDYRISVKDTQEKIEGLQKRLFGRIEEEYKVLSVNLSEIDKKQRNFLEQTKIFDRADSLKVSLEQSIEDLRVEIVRVETQSKELKEIERKFLQIKKLGDEVSAKLTRFIAEKRRIEEMEGDFKKLINISSAVDVKLDQVTASHDTLQAIQSRIRNLEELEKEVAARYDRLDNKRDILETTISGVDKNFQNLQNLEVGIKGIEESLSVVPQRIREISSQIDVLAKGKEKADSAMKRMEDIDLLLKELEERIENLQKAREWLAKTETRLEEINKQAQDQVKLLGSLLKEGPSGDKKDKGAPSMNVREMVIRLARQGWSVNEIAQATKISRGEVELILELGAK